MIKERLEEDRIITEREIDAILNEKLAKLNINTKNIVEEKEHLKRLEHHHPKPLHHEPKPKPHEKLKLDLDNDFEILLSIFDDEFTANAVIKSLKESPVEIQIIAQIAMNLYRKIDEIYGE